MIFFATPLASRAQAELRMVQLANRAMQIMDGIGRPSLDGSLILSNEYHQLSVAAGEDDTYLRWTSEPFIPRLWRWSSPQSLEEHQKGNRGAGTSRFLSNEFISCFHEEVSQMAEEERREDFPSRLPLFCRRFAEIIVAAVETTLQRATEISGSSLFNAFLVTGGLSGTAQMKAFGQALARAGVTYSEEVLDDFLAIKYLRNTRAHGAWRQNHIAYLQSRGFPSDLRKFVILHWHRMKEVYLGMMDYILKPTLAPLWRVK